MLATVASQRQAAEAQGVAGEHAAAGGLSPNGELHESERPIGTDVDATRGDELATADDGYGIVLDESVYAAGEAAAGRVCPACASSLAAEAIVCVNCGFNTKESVMVKAPPKKKKENKAATPKCRHCGYDIRGLNTLTCPECGGKISMSRRDRDFDDSRAVMRKAYLRPVIMTVVGVGATAAIYAAAGLSLAIIVHVVVLAVVTAFSTFAFFLCCLLWIGFDAPMHLSALRLLGIFAVLWPLGTLYGILPGFISIILLLMTAVGLLSSELELDLPDAVLFGLALGLIQLAGFSTILALVNQMF